LEFVEKMQAAESSLASATLPRRLRSMDHGGWGLLPLRTPLVALMKEQGMFLFRDQPLGSSPGSLLGLFLTQCLGYSPEDSLGDSPAGGAAANGS